jgi:hypothetical protein
MRDTDESANKTVGPQAALSSAVEHEARLVMGELGRAEEQAVRTAEVGAEGRLEETAGAVEDRVAGAVQANAREVASGLEAVARAVGAMTDLAESPEAIVGNTEQSVQGAVETTSRVVAEIAKRMGR